MSRDHLRNAWLPFSKWFPTILEMLATISEMVSDHSREAADTSALGSRHLHVSAPDLYGSAPRLRVSHSYFIGCTRQPALRSAAQRGNQQEPARK
jgi:hypothetical protein